MKVVDKTPYRSESGEIELMGRLQATLKYGLSWYDRVKAQDVVVGILSKQLNNQYVLLQNVTLPGTEIDLPLVLIGPPGIFLVNVIHERGVYRARDEEWGTISGEQFVPARINQVKRTQTMGRVLQVFLDRQGYKGMLMVDSILMSADPGTHIDSTRPAVRVVMSDALERFAISMGQGRVVLSGEAVNEVVRAIIEGHTRPGAESAEGAGTAAFTPGSFTPAESAEAFDFSFEEAPAAEAETASTDTPVEAAPQERPQAPARKTPAKRKGALGFSRIQWIILIGMIVFLLCVLAVFAAIIILNLNVLFP